MIKVLYHIVVIVVFTFLLTPVYLTAQNFRPNAGPQIVGKISGQVIDSLTREPVEFATISLRFQDSSQDINGVISTSGGEFKITEVKPGKYDLYITFIGYQSKKIAGIELTLKEPDYDCGNIFLVVDEVILEQVEVIGQAALVENKVDRIVYNAEKDASIIGGDATDVLRKVPMLSVDLEGNVSLRGSQNVKILVNGKPSGMFSSNVADALKMFPADQIKEVELITSPGAKYDAEGTGGIINIITKKKNVDGYNASLRTSLGTRQNSASLNVNAAKGRFGINGGGNVYYSIPQDAKTSFFRSDITDAGPRTLDQNGVTNNTRIGFWGRGGAFYDFNAYNSINANFNLRGFTFDQENTMDIVYNDPFFDNSYTSFRSQEGGTGTSGYDLTTDYTRKYEQKGKELSIAIQLNRQNQDTDFDLTQNYTTDVFPLRREKSINDGKNTEWTFQTDYIHPFSDKFKWEVGAKAIVRKIVSDYNYEFFDPVLNAFTLDALRTDLFDYEQDVASGYSSFTLDLGKDYSFVAGGRYEYTKITGDFASDINSKFSNEYANFFPNFILSKKIGFNTVKLSYNRRISRPSLFFINPYQNNSDNRNIAVGNPYLAPELSDQIDIGYTSFKKGTVVSTSVYYRKTNDVIQSLLTIDENGVGVTTNENIGETNAYGANIFTSFTLMKIWIVRANLDVNAFTSKGISLTGEALENDGIQYRIFTSSSFNLKKGWKAEVFGFWNSPRYTLQGKNPSFSMINFSVNKEILKKKGNIGIVIVEPFSEFKDFKSELSGVNFSQTSNFQLPFRSFGLNFSYRIGKLDFNTQNRRSKIRSDDLKQGGDNQGAAPANTGQGGG